MPVPERYVEPKWGQVYNKEPHKLRAGGEYVLYKSGVSKTQGAASWVLAKHKRRLSRRPLGKAGLRFNKRFRFVQPPSASTLPVSLQRLLDLLGEKGEDDFGVVDPTQFAFKTAIEFVLNAESTLDRSIKSAPVVDSEGGIRITWRSGDRQVKLICPATPSGAIYVYESSPTGSSVLNQNVTSATLAGRLLWLLHGDESEQPTE